MITKIATKTIIIQSSKDSTLVDNKPPISKLVSGIVTFANWTKNSNKQNDAKNAMLIALLENTPNENMLSSWDLQFITLNN